MFIIWDEFTEYIRSNDLDIIQQLSLFSKEVPFFIIYVMHEYPGVFSENVTAGLGKADARFHKIDVSLSEKTTLKLIGESIITRDGMKDNWADICDDLYSSISGSVHAFMGDPGSDLDSNTLKKIFPIHPMTVNLVSKVAGLAASNRSIFEFLKSNGDDGFRAYIHNNGQFDWKWVTPDYLWEYFFVNNFSGKKTLTKMAEDALKHYTKVKSQISDERMLRVFKGAMLLLATIGSGHSLKKSKGSKGIQATEKTLCDCFCGMLTKDEVSSYLKILSADPLNVLVLAPDIHEGARIELPYSGTGGELDAEIERLKKDNPLLDGGAQESEHRAGTENVASIVGMARALEDNCSCLHDNTERILEMEKALLSELTAAHVHFHRNGCEPRIPGNISLSLSGIDGEALLHRLDLRGICVSTGSACDSVNTQISHVLRAISLDEKLAKGTIRISLGKNNTAEEAGIIGKEIVKILNGR